MGNDCKEPIRSFEIEGHSYFLQRRPRHLQLVTIDRPGGVRIIDPWTGATIQRVGSPEPRPSIIDAWCFRADGREVILMANEEGQASLLSLEPGGASFALARPPFDHVFDLRYVWDEDSFAITSGQTRRFFELVREDGKPRFVEVDSYENRKKHPAWRRALDGLTPYECNVLRTEPDADVILFWEHAKSPPEIGVLDWRRGTRWSAPFTASVPRLARHERQLFVLDEYDIQFVNEQGQRHTLCRAPDGFHFLDFEVLPPSDANPAALAALAPALAGPKDRLLVYELNS